jgi:hypothetical protein
MADYDKIESNDTVAILGLKVRLGSRRKPYAFYCLLRSAGETRASPGLGRSCARYPRLLLPAQQRPPAAPVLCKVPVYLSI